MASPDEIIGDARNYASGLVGIAESSLNDAISAVEWAREPQVNIVYANLPAPPPATAALVAPTLAGITLDLPAQPSSALVFQDISAIEAGAAPTLTASAPTVELPNKPSGVAEFTALLPSINLSAQFPQAPDLIMPDAPTLVDRAEPIAPTTIIPTFTGVLPTDIPGAPTDLEGTFNAAYHTAAPEFIAMVNGHVDAQLAKLNPQYHAQMARIETQLAAYMDGGTGLNPAVENAIYERARSKNNAESRRVRDQAWGDAAARGFTLPTGALMAASQQARQAAADNNAAAAREIVVMQAEYEQKNLQFAVTTSVGLRMAMVNATLSYMQNLGTLNGQALDYAKSILGAVVEMYNTQVKVYMTRLEGYKTEAAVFETLMRGALAGVEVYKAEVDALRALTQVDQAKIDVYRARIDVLTAASNMYKTQVDAVVSKASLEKLKIDVFQAQVQAFQAQVQAKNSEWQGYSAAIGGEEAKSRVFNSQVQAYGAQVQGYKATIDAKAEAVRAQATTNDARARQFTATMSGYQTIVQAKGEVARTQLENQRQEIIAFQAESQAAIANAQVALEYYKATGNVSVENARLILQSSIADVNAKSEWLKSLATLHSANATIHGNLAGAAMAGMNTLAANTETTSTSN